MNKTIPIIILLLLVSLLGGYIFVYKSDFEENTQWRIKKTETTTLSYEEQKVEEKLQAERDTENYNNAIREKRLDLCELISDREKKDGCRDIIGASEALQEKNPELCSTLSNSGIRDRCLDNISYFLATEKSLASLCENIRDETISTQCVKSIEESNFESHMASGSLDIAFCETVTDKSLSDECKRKISTEKDSEFYREAISSSAITTCENINDPVVKSKCKDAVLFDLAIKEGNLDYCTNIADNERSEYCRKSLLGRQDVSRYQQFVRSGNLDSCNELSVIQMRNQCHDTIIFAKVRETRDEGLCDLLYNSGITFQCRDMISEERNN